MASGLNSLEAIETYRLARRPDGIIVDTDVLHLLLVGLFDPKEIESCSLLQDGGKNFKEEDFKLALDIVSRFKKVVITPHILAELSNQSKQAFHGAKFELYFQSLIGYLKNTEEDHVTLDSLLQIDLKIIERYGFTDSAIFELARTTGMPIFTDDTKLHIFLENHVPIIKFGHLRYLGLLK